MAQAVDLSADKGAQLKSEGVVIKTEDLRKTYIMGDQEIHAVDGVDLTIMKGEYVALMGPSGSGKSTLMNLIGCLDTPTAGQYYINGRLVSDMDDAYFGGERGGGDQVGYLDGGIARFGKSYTGEPDRIAAELAEDAAVAMADTILMTVPNQLGVDYNAELLRNIAEHIAPAIGWTPATAAESTPAA